MWFVRPDIDNLVRRGKHRALIRLLSHRDSDVRLRAAKALCNGLTPGAKAALFRALGDQEPEVQAAAAEALAAFNDDDVWASLSEILEQPAANYLAPALRRAIVRALVTWGRPLHPALKSDAAKSLRAEDLPEDPPASGGLVINYNKRAIDAVHLLQSKIRERLWMGDVAEDIFDLLRSDPRAFTDAQLQELATVANPTRWGRGHDPESDSFKTVTTFEIDYSRLREYANHQLRKRTAAR